MEDEKSNSLEDIIKQLEYTALNNKVKNSSYTFKPYYDKDIPEDPVKKLTRTFDNFIVHAFQLLEGTELTIAEKFLIAIAYAKAITELRENSQSIPPGNFRKLKKTNTKDFESDDYREDELWKIYNSFRAYEDDRAKFPTTIPGRPDKKD